MAITILGTPTTQNFIDLVVNNYTCDNHTVAASTGTLLCVYNTRRLNSDQPTFSATWNGVALTAISTNYNTTSQINDAVVYWAAVLHAPTTGAHDLVLSFGASITQKGGTITLFDLDGCDTTTPLGAVIAQSRASTATNTVTLATTPVSAGNFFFAYFGMSEITNVSSSTGTGYTTLATGRTSYNDSLTRVVKYKLNVTGLQTLDAVFAYSDVQIGGVLLEIRSASTTTTDKSATVAIAADVLANKAGLAKAYTTAITGLDGQKQFTSTLVLQADDTNITRAMVRIGTPTSTRFSMQRTVTTVPVVECSALLSDGASAVASSAGSLTAGLSVISWSQAPGIGGNIVIDGINATPSAISGAGFVGGLLLGVSTVEVGTTSVAALNSYSGIIARWIVDKTVWPLAKKQLFAKAILIPDELWGWSARDTMVDSNKSPIALPIYVSINTSQPVIIVPVTIDPDGTQPVIVDTTAPDHGTVVFGNTNMTYTPTTGYIGIDTFSFTIYDGGKLSSALVTITVTNTSLLAVSDNVSLQQDTTVTIKPLLNDTGGIGTVRITGISTPLHGVATLEDEATITYTPTAGYTGSDSLIYTITDNLGSASATINLSIAAVAVANANNDSYTVDRGTAKLLSVLANDTPADIQVNRITAVPSHGTATLATNATQILYTPASGYVGTDNFTYEVIRPANSTIDTASVALNIIIPTVVNYPSGLPFRSGFRMPNNTPSGHDAAMKRVAAWRGRKVDIGSTFMGQEIFGAANAWSLLSNNWVHGMLSGSIALGNDFWTIAIPLLTSATPRQYTQGARGDFDGYHSASAKKLKTIIGNRPVTIRLGWEMDHGYPWSWEDLPNEAPDTPAEANNFKNFWNRIAVIYKNELPGVKMDLNVLRDCVRPLGTWCPSEADIISVDSYNSFGTAFYEQGPANFMGSYVPATGWAKGPRGIAEFALSRGKMWAVPEWGVTIRDLSASSPANSPLFIRAMWNLFNEFKGHLYFECYFQGSSKAPYHDIFEADTPFAINAGNEYLRLWTP